MKQFYKECRICNY